jgi:uncharacterized membrane protein
VLDLRYKPPLSFVNKSGFEGINSHTGEEDSEAAGLVIEGPHPKVGGENKQSLSQLLGTKLIFKERITAKEENSHF